MKDEREDDGDLPQRDVTPTEFRELAKLAGWQRKSIDLFLVGRPIKDRVAVGEKPNRALLRVTW